MGCKRIQNWSGVVPTYKRQPTPFAVRLPSFCDWVPYSSASCVRACACAPGCVPGHNARACGVRVVRFSRPFYITLRWRPVVWLAVVLLIVGQCLSYLGWRLWLYSPLFLADQSTIRQHAPNYQGLV